MKILFAVLFSLGIASPAVADTIDIGVLAYEGRQQALERWQPTADYLSRRLAPHRFRIVPLTHEEFDYAIKKDQLSFALTNPGHYVRLEVNHGASPIATFITRFKEQTLKRLSAVIFTRADSTLSHLDDLKGHRLAAVSREAFSGFQLARDALLNQGIDVLDDMRVDWLGFPHADVVQAVLNGHADAGVVRSGVLEKMASRHQIDLSRIRVLDRRSEEELPLLHSVALFPEWPFARLPSTDCELAKRVTIALMQMQPNDEAAIQSGGAGWTIPLDYSAVHRVLHRLEVEPYPPEPLSLLRLARVYGHWLTALALLLLISLAASIRFFRANKQLRTTQLALHRHQGQLEETVQQHTAELRRANRSLREEIASHMTMEQTLSRGCSAMQALCGIFLRDDLSRRQRLYSIVDSLRQYLGSESVLLSRCREGRFEAFGRNPTNETDSVPLSQSLAEQAISSKQILAREDSDGWKRYIACPVFVGGELCCLLEFSTSQPYPRGRPDDQRAAQAFSLELLNLISQWVGHEMLLLEQLEESESRRLDIQRRFASISPREKEVLTLLVRGESTKSMARALNLSTKTIEMHRANLIRKTQAKSSTELVQLTVLAEVCLDTQ